MVMVLSRAGPEAPKLDSSSGTVQSGCHPSPNSLFPCQWSMASNAWNGTAASGPMGERWLWKRQSEQREAWQTGTVNQGKMTMEDVGREIHRSRDTPHDQEWQHIHPDAAEERETRETTRMPNGKQHRTKDGPIIMLQSAHAHALPRIMPRAIGLEG